MLQFKTEVKIKGMSQSSADEKGKLVEKIANNLDLEALVILADKSSKPNISDKLKKFKNLI